MKTRFDRAREMIFAAGKKELQDIKRNETLFCIKSACDKKAMLLCMKSIKIYCCEDELIEKKTQEQ